MSTLITREFSPNGKYFAYIDSQGKFAVYDVETSKLSQVYTPNLHLTMPCTCFAWIEVTGGSNANAQTTKKKRSISVVESELYVAFGTSKGAVAFYSIAKSKLEQKLQGDGHTGPVAAIHFDRKDTLYTAGADGKVIEWSVSNALQGKVHNIGVEKLSCVLLFDDTIVTGTKQLKLWNRAKGKLRRTLVGHTSDVRLLRLLNDNVGNAYLLSGSIHDRNLSLWSMTDNTTTVVSSFALDDAPEYVTTKVVDAALHLVAISRTGVAHYFVRQFSKLSPKKAVKAKHTFEVVIDAAGMKSKTIDRLPVFVATSEYSPNESQLLIGYGTESNLRFEQITIEPELKAKIIIRDLEKVFGEGAKNMEFKTKTPLVNDGTAEYLNPTNVSKRVSKKFEIPMEARLENLALSQTPTGHKSLIHLLIQGLHSRDVNMLRVVFGSKDEDMIKQTVQKMPPQYVSTLLNELSLLMQKKTVHVETAVCWLKHLVETHASQLMALGAENLQSNFATCLGIMEYRVEHMKSLIKLSGRLDLLVGQIEQNRRLNANPQEAANTKVLVYQEEDDSDVGSVIGKEQEQPLYGEEFDEEDFDDEEDDDENAQIDGKTGATLRNGTKAAESDESDDDSDDSEESDDSDDSNEVMEVSE